ncbi:hypothetical protein UQ64_16000 [Paenibacillus etheri]|uniref:Uncharacterized protein n=2 Tax=Paenibacillus etheri TaxID=1306852 RepID=A0A0W1AYN5_9BACL|nr:hypothetical protein UQ64_16000 [Paenibacillus etheri]
MGYDLNWKAFGLGAFGWAQSVGQGWAAIEVLYTMISVIMITSIINRTDEKSMQAKEILQAQGNLQASPLWGILERIWASAFHIGATLVIASSAWLVIPLIIVHSGLNLVAVRIAKISMFGTNMFVAAVGLITLGVGLFLFCPTHEPLKLHSAVQFCDAYSSSCPSLMFTV